MCVCVFVYSSMYELGFVIAAGDLEGFYRNSLICTVGGAVTNPAKSIGVRAFRQLTPWKRVLLEKLTASREIPSILLRPTVHYCLHKSLPYVLIQSYINVWRMW